MRRMFKLLGVVRRGHHRICPNRAFHLDLMWWAMFLESWNGTSMIREWERTRSVTHIWTDAQGVLAAGPPNMQMDSPRTLGECSVHCIYPEVLSNMLLGRTVSDRTIISQVFVWDHASSFSCLMVCPVKKGGKYDSRTLVTGCTSWLSGLQHDAKPNRRYGF